MLATAVRLTFLVTLSSVAVTAGGQGTADGLPPSHSPTPAKLRVASYAPTTPSTQNATAGLRVTGRTYDDFDRLSSETVQLQDGTTATLTYTYWNNGQRKTVTDAAGRVTFYEYDGRNRLARLTTNQGLPDKRVAVYAYWPDSLLKSVTKPDGTVTSYDYDRADRLTSIAVRKGETDLLSYAYTYDRNGNRTKQVEANGGSAETTTYTYDDLNRLETVTYPGGRSVTYGYDGVGNRTAETERNPTGVVVSDKGAVFDAANRLRSVTDAVNPANNATFAYDANGNLKTKTTAAEAATYTYDVRDLLVETGAGAAITARFAYDAFGRRYLKIGAEGLRQYLYDQTSLLEEFSETNVEVAKYEWDAERLVSLARLEEPRRHFHFDALGSVAALTDETGGVAARYHYDAWGRHRDVAELDASANRFGFTGHYFDTETKLYYAKARYFDPDFGRFLTADSYLGQIDNPPSLHRYFYANANPLRYVDPTGHASFKAEDIETNELRSRVRQYSPALNKVIREKPGRGGAVYGRPEDPDANVRALLSTASGDKEAAQGVLDDMKASHNRRFASVVVEESDFDANGRIDTSKVYQQFLKEVGGHGGALKGLREEFLAAIECAVPDESRDISFLYNVAYEYSTAKAYEAASEDAKKHFGPDSIQRNAHLAGQWGAAPRDVSLDAGATLAMDTLGAASLGLGIYRAGAALVGVAGESAEAGTMALVPRGTKSLGQWGETRLADVLKGAGIKPSKPFSTSLGKRYVDRLVDGVAHEAKAGIDVGLASSVELQIAKDVELITSGQVRGAHWHFFQGAKPELLDELTRNGIQYTVH